MVCKVSRQVIQKPTRPKDMSSNHETNHTKKTETGHPILANLETSHPSSFYVFFFFFNRLVLTSLFIRTFDFKVFVFSELIPTICTICFFFVVFGWSLTSCHVFTCRPWIFNRFILTSLFIASFNFRV